MHPVLITGCSSGIGRYAAFALQQRGYRVIASARRAHDVAQLRDQGLEAVQLDVASPARLHQGLDEALALTGGELYALINNAGFGLYGALEDVSGDALRAQFASNVFGPHELSARVLPLMRRQGRGRIVQISSVLGLVASPYRGAYVASKFALEGLSDALRLELRGSGVFVALIEPGPISSRFGDNAEAALHRYLPPDCCDGERGEHYRALIAQLRGERDSAAGRFRLGPEAVYKKIVLALESRAPRPRYYVTQPTVLMAMLRRLLPTRTLDRLLARR